VLSFFFCLVAVSAFFVFLFVAGGHDCMCHGRSWVFAYDMLYAHTCMYGMLHITYVYMIYAACLCPASVSVSMP